MTTVLEATEISGITYTEYPSSAVNKKYVDAISGNLNTKIGSAGGISGWQEFTGGDHSLTGFGANTYAISGDASLTLAVAGYDTISSNAKKAKSSAQVATYEAFRAIVTDGDDVYADGPRDTLTFQGDGAGITTAGVAGDDTVVIQFKGYSTISGNAKVGADLSNDSGSKYSGWYSSGAKFAVAYDHSQSNTKAHSDYLVNNEDDETSGKLTMAGADLGANTLTVNSIEIVGSDGEVNKAAVEDSTNWDSAYDWFAESSSKLSTISGSLSDRINAAGGGISGWYDLDTGLGITAFGGSVSISGTQAETLSVADYIASTNAVANFPNSGVLLGKYYPSTLGKGVSGAVYANTCHSANSAIHFSPGADLVANSISSSRISGTFVTGDLTINANAISGLVDPIWPSAASNKHYVDTISGNLSAKYLHSGVKLHTLNSQAISSNFLGCDGTHITLKDTIKPYSTNDITMGSDTQSFGDFYMSNAILCGYMFRNNNTGTYMGFPKNNNIVWTCNTVELARMSGGVSQTKFYYSPYDGASCAAGSGLVMQSMNGEGKIELEHSPLTYSIANIKISANQNINLARFKCPGSKKAHLMQAYACCSSGKGVGDLYVQMLANSSLPLNGSHSLYKTSSATIQQGEPLAESSDGDHVEIRFMYSGDTFAPEGGNQYQIGTAMMQVAIY